VVVGRNQRRQGTRILGGKMRIRGRKTARRKGVTKKEITGERRNPKERQETLKNQKNSRHLGII
jgi:hypothetical protein